ncbi:hypothetical protein B0I32_10256 [Nonomuraea fuscirosea]|uniref:Uncharacterized protein n=1 Tax=Nonomuraea fuscirosea TaxID=1291556 RepID=A0A2T0N8D1_9ACTN|nr:hypothetical protein B0I32_10256 [Nonomuraea fuscirosea]
MDNSVFRSNVIDCTTMTLAHLAEPTEEAERFEVSFNSSI